MSGISAIISYSNKDITIDLLNSLNYIQHRGNYSHGITTINILNNINTFKDLGPIPTHDIFSKHAENIKSCIGIGNINNNVNSKPFTKLFENNNKFIISHNGNVKINPDLIKSELGIKFSSNINSDTELILNILIHKLSYGHIDVNAITKSLRFLEYFVIGSYSVILYISTIGLIVFRDKYGHKPLSIGRKNENYLIISESVGIKGIDYEHLCDVGAGEVIIFYDKNINTCINTCIKGNSLIVRKQYSENPILKPCILEWVNIANVSSIIDGVSVYESRLKMGEQLGNTIIDNITKIWMKDVSLADIDYVCPIHDISRPSSLMVAEKLRKVYRELIIIDSEEKIKNSNKNTFLMIDHLIKDKNILIVTDSIVSGNTLICIVSEMRKRGVNKIIVASCSPPIKHIDILDPELLIANGKNNDEIANALGADLVIYQKIEDLKKSISDINPDINNFEMSVFEN